MKSPRPLIAVAALLAALVIIPASAEAAPIFKYSISIDQQGAGNPAPTGQITIYKLLTDKDTNVIVMPPTGPPRFTGTQPIGPTNDSYAFSAPGISPGDTIYVRQPAASVNPTETYVIPPVSLNVVNGASAITGSIPAGLVGAVVGDYRCAVSPDWHNLGAGAFSVPYVKILPGESVTLNAVSPTGDNTLITTTSNGETPCIEVYAAGHVQPAPGSPPDPTPFRIQVSHLVQSLFPTLRVVLRRGSTTLLDKSTSSSYVNEDVAAQPQPGDVIDIYRPQGAPAPTYSATIPQVSAVFDASVDRVAVDGPAARVLYASPCRAFGCVNENVRSTRDAPAGRTILDFSKPEGSSSPVDMRPDDFVFTQYVNPENTLTYAFRAQSGDLVAPVQSFKLAGKIKISALIKALKKGLKVKLNSNEVGTAKLTLGKFAAAKGNVKVGTNTLTLKFSKSGKKAVKKFAAKGKKAKPLAVTLTSVVKDASGNASTVTKTTKIKP